MNKLALSILAGTTLAALSACSDKDEAMISDNEAADAAAAMPAEETVPVVEDEPAEASTASAPTDTEASTPVPSETP